MQNEDMHFVYVPASACFILCEGRCIEGCGGVLELYLFFSVSVSEI